MKVTDVSVSFSFESRNILEHTIDWCSICKDEYREEIVACQSGQKLPPKVINSQPP